jgi:hypothetical protein
VYGGGHHASTTDKRKPVGNILPSKGGNRRPDLTEDKVATGDLPMEHIVRRSIFEGYMQHSVR